MPTLLYDSEIKVSMEMADGRVFAGRCKMGSINVEENRDDLYNVGEPLRTVNSKLSWNMNLRGIGNPTWQMGGDLAPGIVTRFLPEEWACEYCGRANSLKQQQCQSCGWYRGLIIDVAQEAGIWRVRR